MDYLKNIKDTVQFSSKEKIIYIDIYSRPDLFTGIIEHTDKLDFCKIPLEVQDETVRLYGKATLGALDSLKSSPCGAMMRFRTNSSRLILKVRFKRKWGYQKIINWNGCGFDVYKVNNGVLEHVTVFAPSDGHDTFAECIQTPGEEVCIYLPSYNTIMEFYLGIEEDSYLEPLSHMNPLPVVFYGNSVTQGASASRSGNIFPNIVGRKLNRDVVNLSCSFCCRGQLGMADLIGQLNCHSIVIDYTRNASNETVFRDTYGVFYERIRKWHPDKPVILMTSACYNHWRDYDAFDRIVEQTWKEAVDHGDNTILLRQRELFQEDEYDVISPDGIHYIDYGMYKVADAITELLQEKSK